MHAPPPNSLRNFIYSSPSMAIDFLLGGRIVLRTIIHMLAILSRRLDSVRRWGMCIGLVRLAKMGEHHRRSISAVETRYRSIIDRATCTAQSQANECWLSKEKLSRV